MESITLDGTKYDMADILNMTLVFNDDASPGQWQIEVVFSGEVIQYVEMTTENVASFNAWVAHGRTFIPKSARGMKGPK